MADVDTITEIPDRFFWDLGGGAVSLHNMSSVCLRDRVQEMRWAARRDIQYLRVPSMYYYDLEMWGVSDVDGYLTLYCYYGSHIGGARLSPLFGPGTYANAANTLQTLTALEVQARERAGFVLCD